jgi:hypothetical protein
MSVHSLGIVAKASDEGAQNCRVQPKRHISVIKPPRFKVWAVRQAEAFEKFTAERRRKRLQCLRIQDVEVSGSKGSHAFEVQVDCLRAEENGIVVRMQTLMTFSIHNWPEFVEAPP